MEKQLLVQVGTEQLFKVTNKERTYLLFENLAEYREMGFSEDFLKNFIELFDSRKFYKNFTDRNHTFVKAPEDTTPNSFREVLAKIGGLQICRDENLSVCVVSQDSEIKMTLDFVDRLIEVLGDYDNKTRAGKNSRIQGSNLFTKN